MISEISLVNLAKTTPYSLDDIQKIAAQVDKIEDLLDILSHAKATNSDPFEVLREFETHGGIFYDGKNYHDEGDMSEKEKQQELNTEAIQAAVQAITEANAKFCQYVQAVAEKITPEFQALLAALPEPEDNPEGEKELEDEDPLNLCPDLLDHATEFILDGYELRKYGREGAGLWSIYDKQDRIYRRISNKHGGFVSGPLPKDSTDEFINETRFTLVEALRIVKGLGNLRKL